jgi:type I restriction enzyme S subunit
MTAWPLVPLGKVLTHRKEFIQIDDSSRYRRCRVQLHAQGIVLRDEVPGIEIKTKAQQVCSDGELLVAEIDAKVGGFGIVPASLNGAIVSSHYFLFTVNPALLDVRFLGYYVKTAAFRDQVTAQGSTNYAAIRPSHVLAYTTPLPPIAEQRRIVERIEIMWDKAATLEGLHTVVGREVGMLLAAEEIRIWPNEALRDAETLEQVTVYLARGRQSEQGESPHYLIKTQHVQERQYIRSRMTLAPHISAKVASDALAQPDDILIACSAAGCLGRVAFFQETDQVASTDTHVAIARANRDRIIPEYLYAYLRGAQGQVQLRSREKGDWQREKIGFRFTELNVADMRRVPVPLPGLEEQRRIVEYLERFTDKMNTLRTCQAQRGLEIAALRPSVLNSAFSGRL